MGTAAQVSPSFLSPRASQPSPPSLNTGLAALSAFPMSIRAALLMMAEPLPACPGISRRGPGLSLRQGVADTKLMIPPPRPLLQGSSRAPLAGTGTAAGWSQLEVDACLGILGWFQKRRPRLWLLPAGSQLPALSVLCSQLCCSSCLPMGPPVLGLGTVPWLGSFTV